MKPTPVLHPSIKHEWEYAENRQIPPIKKERGKKSPLPPKALDLNEVDFNQVAQELFDEGLNKQEN